MGKTLAIQAKQPPTVFLQLSQTRAIPTPALPCTTLWRLLPAGLSLCALLVSDLCYLLIHLLASLLQHDKDKPSNDCFFLHYFFIWQCYETFDCIIMIHPYVMGIIVFWMDGSLFLHRGRVS